MDIPPASQAVNEETRTLNDDELWDIITGRAASRSGEYVPVDDLKFSLSPFSPFVDETNDTNYWHG